MEFPRALTALVGIRDMGAQPRELGDSVVGTIDLTELYLFNRREFVTQTAVAAGAVGTVTVLAGLIVPAGEAWFVHFWQISAQTAAGEALSISPALRLAGGSITVGNPAVLPASTTTWGIPLHRGFWLAPGEGLGAVTTQITGAPVVAGAASITRLRV